MAVVFVGVEARVFGLCCLDRDRAVVNSKSFVVVPRCILI